MAKQPPDQRPSAPTPSPTDNGMVARIKRLITTPATEWDRIDAEPMTEKGIMTGWVAPLAAIGPAATLIGGQLFGWRILGAVVKPALGSAIAGAVVTWLLAIAGAYVLAIIIDALAPTFGATKDKVAALKVAAFSATAGWLAGIFGIIPSLAFLGILGLYSLYLFWIGLPKLMKAPGDKVIGYVAATIVSAVVIYMVVGAVATQLMPAPSMPSITISG